MDCGQNVESLSAYVDNALEADERVRVVAHLQDCPHCRLEHLRLERAKALVSAQPLFRMPAALRARIAGMLEDAAPEPSQAALRTWLGTLVPSAPRLASAGAFAALALSFAVWTERRAPQEPTVPLKSLLAEHARSSRKSPDVHRATMASAPYDYIAWAQETQ